MAEENKVNAGTIALVGFVGTVLVLEIILLLMVLFYRVTAQLAYEKDISQPAAELLKIETAQRAKLNEYRWADPQKKIAAIPISRAMKLVVKEIDRGETGTGKTPPASKQKPETPESGSDKTPAANADAEKTRAAPGGKEGNDGHQ